MLKITLRLKLRTKLIAVVLITTSMVFGAFLFFNNHQLTDLSKKQAVELAKSYAQKYASTCKNYLDIDMGFTKAIAIATQDFQELTQPERDSIYGGMYLNMLKANPKYISVWNTLELKYTDSTHTKDHGRISIVAIRNGEEFETVKIFKDMDSHNENSAYYQMKQDNIPAIMEPYLDANVGDFLITSQSYPIYIDSGFAGLGGIDLPLTVMQDFIDSLEIIEGTIAMVLSNKGVILGHTNKNLVKDTISNVMDQLNLDKNIVSIIQKGLPDGFSHRIANNSYYTAIVPFLVSGTNTPWAISVSLPITPFVELANSKGRNIIWIGLAGMLFINFLVWLFASQIVKPLTQTTRVFKELSTGNINDSLKLRIKTRDELQELAQSVNSLIEGLQKTEVFAQEIEKGNLNSNFEILGENDRLGNALLRMRQGLIEAQEREDVRHIEDENRNWALDGLAKFSNLMREENDNFEAYAQKIISNLAEYTNSNQGGLYIINSDNAEHKTMTLSGSFGYDGEKFDKQTLEFGEGLVGVCILEARTVYLDELPANYLSISSGLGQSSPHSLMIVPLKHNEVILGAIELAAFKKYEKYQIEFVEEVAKSMAVTIESLKMQDTTTKLLEKTQSQAQGMMEQEEILRQNMEEMMANQEENNRTIEELNIELEKVKKELSQSTNKS